MDHDGEISGDIQRRLAGSTSSPGSPFSYVDIFRAEPSERVDMIKAGMPAAQAKRVLSDLAVSQTVALRALGLSPATMNRKAKGEDRLPPAETELVLGVARLVGQV